jgi:hypothetical protein
MSAEWVIQNPTRCFEILTNRKKENGAPIKENSKFTQNITFLLLFQTLNVSNENGHQWALLYRILKIKVNCSYSKHLSYVTTIKIKF